MKYLGIDYGSKRVGIAVSDENATFALPRVVLPSDNRLVAAIAKICKEESIVSIILGESLNLKGAENKIMEEITPFKKELEGVTRLPVIFEREYFTSQNAERFQGKHAMLDASAAALILQSYLDTLKNKPQ